MKSCQSLFRTALAAAFLCMTLVVSLPAIEAALPAKNVAGQRSTLAITYAEGDSTSVDMIGSATRVGRTGKADIKRRQGRTDVKLSMDALPHPQSIDSFSTTYILWAVAPEGQAASLTEVPHSKSFNIETTTPFQTFGLIVTAEPHSEVTLPGPVIIAENAARKNTTGILRTGSIVYAGASGRLYQTSVSARPDFATPLPVLGARNAVDLARDAGAHDYADKELRQVEMMLATLEGAWRPHRDLPKHLGGTAREVMRTAEHARAVSEERREASRVAAEQRAASEKVARARTEAERARDEAERQRVRAAESTTEADRQRARAAEALTEVERAQAAKELARTEAERARLNEDAARQQAEQARVDAEQARRKAEEAREDRAEMQRKLERSLSAILETRREARGIIVNLSDVLFDFDRASLTPGAREKLSRLAGVLLAYPGKYRIDVEGHTDSIGSNAYNEDLSRNRAQSVHSYLLSAAIPGSRMGSVVGYGETRPVASNDSASGRQMNRRVEIVIADLD